MYISPKTKANRTHDTEGIKEFCSSEQNADRNNRRNTHALLDGDCTPRTSGLQTSPILENPGLQCSMCQSSFTLLSAEASSAVGTATIPMPVSTIASVNIRPATVTGYTSP